MTPAIPAKPKSSQFAKTHLALSFVPWVNLASFWAYAFYVRAQFGRWPKAMIDDPVFPGSNALDNLYGLIFWVTLASAPIWLGLTIFQFARRDTRQILRPFLIFALAWATTYVLSFLDAGHFYDWLMD